ncbi:DUF1566 domain-containing protein [Planctomycetales bacterium ZRK34]|nr:DUF1566 domain-containing protein [Planctomycetales bacterium ZRK34]
MRRFICWSIGLLAVVTCSTATHAQTDTRTYRIVDTGLPWAFSDRAQITRTLRPGDAFYGQDACYLSNPPQYRDNNDGTISDLNTGLMWVKSPALENKPTFTQAVAGAKICRVGGYDDWRLPTIKELYSLIDFKGDARTDPPVAYIDTNYFDFRFGAGDQSERTIDAQYWSATQYLGTTMNGAATVFGVNFADGRIKGYPRDRGRAGGPMRQFVRYVRGNPEYGVNRFVDNHDGTISDQATGLMWAKTDSGRGMNWQQSLAYCENLKLAGHDDWRLPNAKELQSIVDYTRAPDASDPSRRGPAIDPMFAMTDDGAWYWSSTTHLEEGRIAGEGATYVAFGMATGYMTDHRTGRKQLMNVHGAGAQRSDPKSGDASRYPRGRGPQGDVVRILNYARAVRSIDPSTIQRVAPDTARIAYKHTMQGPPGGEQGGPGAREGFDGPGDFRGPPRRGDFRGPGGFPPPPPGDFRGPPIR